MKVTGRNLDNVENDLRIKKVENDLRIKKGKYVVIAKCSDGDVVIGRNGKVAFDSAIAVEIAKEHQNMGAEIVMIRYADYKVMTH